LISLVRPFFKVETNSVHVIIIIIVITMLITHVPTSLTALPGTGAVASAGVPSCVK
jgi:hypothetical protein